MNLANQETLLRRSRVAATKARYIAQRAIITKPDPYQKIFLATSNSVVDAAKRKRHPSMEANIAIVLQTVNIWNSILLAKTAKPLLLGIGSSEL